MSKPIIPTFHNAAHGSLSAPQDIALYLIRWLFANPGDTSSAFEHEMISFRKLEAEYGKTPDELARMVGQQLTDAMEAYFPNKGYQALCEKVVEDGYEDDGSYKGNYYLTLDIVDANNISICKKSYITRDANSNFNVSFEGGESNG